MLNVGLTKACLLECLLTVLYALYTVIWILCKFGEIWTSVKFLSFFILRLINIGLFPPSATQDIPSAPRVYPAAHLHARLGPEASQNCSQPPFTYWHLSVSSNPIQNSNVIWPAAYFTSVLMFTYPFHSICPQSSPDTGSSRCWLDRCTCHCSCMDWSSRAP